jgi:exopolyphosphatase/guanosine-5'-triphosphate,3'-diphosphate pyrophosphatase
MIDRARVLGAALRLAYVISAAMPGVLPQTTLAVERHRLALRLPGEYAALGGERALTRLRALSRLIGRDPVMLMG